MGTFGSVLSLVRLRTPATAHTPRENVVGVRSRTRDKTEWTKPFRGRQQERPALWELYRSPSPCHGQTVGEMARHQRWRQRKSQKKEAVPQPRKSLVEACRRSWQAFRPTRAHRGRSSSSKALLHRSRRGRATGPITKSRQHPAQPTMLEAAAPAGCAPPPRACPADNGDSASRQHR